MISRATVFSLLFWCSPCTGFTQIIDGGPSSGSTPLWTTNVQGVLRWMRFTSGGVLLVCTSQALSGHDPVTGNTLWSLSALADCAEAGITDLEATPFVAVVPSPWRGPAPVFTREQARAGQTPPSRPDPVDLPYVINAKNGTVLFSSDTTLLSAVTRMFPLQESGCFLIQGTSETGEMKLLCLDANRGGVRWSRTGELADPIAAFPAGTAGVLIGTSSRLIQLDASTGKENWSRSPDPHLSAKGVTADKLRSLVFVTPLVPGACFMVQQRVLSKPVRDLSGNEVQTGSLSTAVNGWNVTDGSALWNTSSEFAYPFGAVIPLHSGLLVGSLDNGAFVVLDRDNGRSIWPSRPGGEFLKGPVSSAVSVDGGTLVSSGGKEATAFLFDAAGNHAWSDPVVLNGPMVGVAQVSSWLRLCSPNQCVTKRSKAGPASDIGSSNSGWPRTAVRGLDFVEYADGELRLLSGEMGKFKALGTTHDRLGTVEIDRLDLLNEGYFLSGNGAFAILDTRGEVIHERTYHLPTDLSFLRPFIEAEQARNKLADHLAGWVFRPVDGPRLPTTLIRSPNDGSTPVELAFRQLANGMSKSEAEFLRSRLTMVSENEGTHFILEQEEAVSAVHFQAIRKMDGSVISNIEFGKDLMNARYALDLVSATVAVFDGSSITSYTLK